MTIALNGESRNVPPGSTVRDLVDRLGAGATRTAVILNDTIVPRDRHADAALHDGDRVEILTLAGGG
ncbi:MAG: sulfur carrier protein ThiS [Lentisphaeria bacterium]|nr:sulfur carrier protein ThiS [Lentisphaeria bacterium]